MNRRLMATASGLIIMRMNMPVRRPVPDLILLLLHGMVWWHSIANPLPLKKVSKWLKLREGFTDQYAYQSADEKRQNREETSIGNRSRSYRRSSFTAPSVSFCC